MKSFNAKTLANAGLFFMGYALVTIGGVSVLAGYNIARNITCYLPFPDVTLPDMIGSITVLTLLVLAISSLLTKVGIALIKRSFDETVPAWLVLRKGQMVVLEEVSGVGRSAVLHVRFYPFDAYARTESIRFWSFGWWFDTPFEKEDARNEMWSALGTGRHYYYHDGVLMDVIKKQ